jgi:NIMA (never in mitosis gene a)-related kinase
MLTHLQPHHANVIRYFAVEASPQGLERYYIYLEFCSGGDLLDQLRSFRNSSTAPGPTAPVVFTLHVIVSLAHALAFLHHGLRWKTETTYEDPKEGKAWDAVIHGDIKPDNIFLRHHPHAQVKGLPDVVLGDFGMSQFASQSTGITGTPGYDSPEVRAVADLRDTNPTLYDRRRNARVMTTKSDVYQLGLVMYLMGSGRHFKIGADPAGIELESLEYKGVTGFLALMVWCLQPEAKERPECTSELVDGCLFAVDVLMRKRDGMVAEEVGKLTGVWNIVGLSEEGGRDGKDA